MKKKTQKIQKLNIRKEDIVRVIAGEYKGKQGKVLYVEPKKQRAIVEGVNFIHKHQRPDADNPQGAIIKKEAAVHVSNLMLLDPKTNEPTRVGRKRNSEGKLVRYAKKSGEVFE